MAGAANDRAMAKRMSCFIWPKQWKDESYQCRDPSKCRNQGIAKQQYGLGHGHTNQSRGYTTCCRHDSLGTAQELAYLSN
jgi:hypothetical protein